jgi:hypothetical protein
MFLAQVKRFLSIPTSAKSGRVLLTTAVCSITDRRSQVIWQCLHLFSKMPRPALGPIHFPIQLVSGAVTPGINSQRHSPYSVEVTNRWLYKCTPLLCFHVVWTRETYGFKTMPRDRLCYWPYRNSDFTTRNAVHYIVANHSRTPRSSLPVSWPAVCLGTSSHFRCDGR